MASGISQPFRAQYISAQGVYGDYYAGSWTAIGTAEDGGQWVFLRDGQASGSFFVPDDFAGSVGINQYYDAETGITEVPYNYLLGVSVGTHPLNAFDYVRLGSEGLLLFGQAYYEADANQKPVATIEDHTVAANQWARLSDWLSYSDPDGNAPIRYQFFDAGTGGTSGYFWTSANAHHDANSTIQVEAADLASVWVRGGTGGGLETMWVRAFDGYHWSEWDAFTLNTLPNTRPVVSIADISIGANGWAPLWNYLSASDADGNAIQLYQFYDAGSSPDSSHLYTPGNPHFAADTYLNVDAADINSMWVHAGNAAWLNGYSNNYELMWVRGFDGIDWSDWDAFYVTTLA